MTPSLMAGEPLPAGSRPVTEHVFRPLRTLVTASVLSVVLVVASVVGFFLLPADVRALFDPLQIGTLIVFLIVMVTVMMSLGLCYVRTTNTGLVVRNGLRTHRLAWNEVERLRFQPGDPFAYVYLPEADHRGRLQLMGIQAADGRRGRAQFAELVRAREAWLGD